MRKATLNIPFDEEKYSTMKLYLDQKGVSIEDELVRHLEALYTKTVPPVVREFLDLRAGKTVEQTSVKSRRTRASTPVDDSESEVSNNV